MSNNRRISHLLLSNSLLVPTGVLQPTPLCHIAKVTLFFPVGGLGRVKSAKKSRSMRVSMSSSARGFASSNSSSTACCLSSPCWESSNRTSPAREAFLVLSSYVRTNGNSASIYGEYLFLLAPQKNRSSQSCSSSISYT